MRLLALALAVALLLGLASAWGPVTHYASACQSSYGQGAADTASCLCGGSVTARSLMLGSAAPDAFYFGASFADSPLCPAGLAALHDLVFAGHMFQLARSQPGLSSPSFDAVAFAAGFASHTAADHIGFELADGFFVADRSVLVGPVAGNASTIDWLYTWPLMLAVDAVVLQNISTCLLQFPNAAGLDADGAAFLAAASAAYHALNPATPSVNASTAAACTAAWMQHVAITSRKAALVTPVDATLAVLAALNPYAASRAKRHDAATALALQLACAEQVTRVWLAALLAGSSPEDAALTMQATAKGLVCAPSL